MIGALVPVKTLATSKSRLARGNRDAIEGLALAMMSDVLDALLAVPAIDRVAVITPDANVARAAIARGAEAIVRDDPGLNAAIEAGCKMLAPMPDDAALVVLGDVAAAHPDELALLIASLERPGAVLAPSSDGGTSALLRSPHDVIPASFGPKSAQAHRTAAKRAGVTFIERDLPSLAIDVDVTEDARAILTIKSLGERTRTALEPLLEPYTGMNRIELLALEGIPSIQPGDDLAPLILSAATAQGIDLADGALVVCQKIVSKAEGRIVALADVEPSDEARRIAAEDDKDPRHVEIVLRETKRIVRRGHRVLISETAHGFVCANAGVDLSNASGPEHAVLLPLDPDASARALHDALVAHGAGPLGVIVSDTFGRPWREGLVDIALGCAGMSPLDDQRGGADLAGRVLEVTTMATADQLAAAAGLLMPKHAAIPAVFVRGVPIEGDGALADLIRPAENDLFR